MNFLLQQRYQSTGTSVNVTPTAISSVKTPTKNELVQAVASFDSALSRLANVRSRLLDTRTQTNKTQMAWQTQRALTALNRSYPDQSQWPMSTLITQIKVAGLVHSTTILDRHVDDVLALGKNLIGGEKLSIVRAYMNRHESERALEMFKKSMSDSDLKRATSTFVVYAEACELYLQDLHKAEKLNLKSKTCVDALEQIVDLNLLDSMAETHLTPKMLHYGFNLSAMMWINGAMGKLEKSQRYLDDLRAHNTLKSYDCRRVINIGIINNNADMICQGWKMWLEHTKTLFVYPSFPVIPTVLSSYLEMDGDHFEECSECVEIFIKATKENKERHNSMVMKKSYSEMISALAVNEKLAQMKDTLINASRDIGISVADSTTPSGSFSMQDLEDAITASDNEKIVQVSQQLLEEGKRIPTVHLAAVTSATQNLKNIEFSDALYKSTRRPPFLVANSHMKVLGEAGKLNESYQVYRQMIDNLGYQLRYQDTLTLIQRFVGSNEQKKAMAVMNDLIQQARPENQSVANLQLSIPIPAVPWNIMIHACCRNNNNDQAMSLFNQMTSPENPCKSTPNIGTYNMMLMLYLQTGNSLAFDSVYSQLRENLNKPMTKDLSTDDARWKEFQQFQSQNTASITIPPFVRASRVTEHIRITSLISKGQVSKAEDAIQQYFLDSDAVMGPKTDSIYNSLTQLLARKHTSAMDDQKRKSISKELLGMASNFEFGTKEAVKQFISDSETVVAKHLSAPQ